MVIARRTCWQAGESEKSLQQAYVLQVIMYLFALKKKNRSGKEDLQTATAARFQLLRYLNDDCS